MRANATDQPTEGRWCQTEKPSMISSSLFRTCPLAAALCSFSTITKASEKPNMDTFQERARAVAP